MMTEIKSSPFEGEDDAMRYAMMLEDEGSPTMRNEIEDKIMIKTCEM